MPTADQILNGLREIANTWRIVSILWHIYFGAFVVVLAMGICPSKRNTGLLLGLPFISVSVFAWLSSNSFNAVVFAVVGIMLLLIAAKLKRDSVQVTSLWSLIPGALLFAFGWIYPHFLNTSSYLPYLYAAPVGIIPCPTLILGIGAMLVLDNLGSRSLSIILGIAGLLYGIIAASRLLASFITGWLNERGGYPLAFFVSSGLAGLAILLLVPIRESPHQANLPSLRVLGRLLVRRDVSVSSLLNAIGQYTLMASVWGFIPILAQRMGAGNIQISLLTTVHIVFIILGSLIASRQARLVKGWGMLTISFVLMAAGIGLAALAPSLMWVFAAQVIHGFSIGLSYPVLMGLAIENVPADERSTALGLHQSIYAIGLFAGPWLSGILANSFGIQPMFAITALACLILGVIGVRWLFLVRSSDRITA